jgi:hypothetical protein
MELDEAKTSLGVDEWALVPSLRRCEQEINCYGTHHVIHCTLLQSGHAGVNSYTLALFRTTELGTSPLHGVHG